MTIETKGLAELGIELKAPYGPRSLQHVLLTNNGPHYVLACDIVFEMTTSDGAVFTARKVVYSHPLLEKNLDKRKALLESEPGISPNSSWLIGFDETGLQPVLEGVPELEPGFNGNFPDIAKCTHLGITLSGVVIETGEAFGPQGQAFLSHLEQEILKDGKR